MIKLIPPLLLIPACWLAMGVAHSADPPAGMVRIAAITAPNGVTVPQAHAIAAATNAEPHLPAPLDLRPPDLASAQGTDSPVAPNPEDWDEQRAVAVVAGSSQSQDRSGTYVSPAGIGSLYWAARHPAQAWRVLLPVQPADEFEAYESMSARCALVPSARVVPGPPLVGTACR
ncbi:MAG: hypothetical protein JWN85_3285 [Gammaproteobacteria bacterium]|nr:hypothetical protein [Gammaproteobacteria bacterium]